MEYLKLTSTDPYQNGFNHGKVFKSKIQEFANKRWNLLKENYLMKASEEDILKIAVKQIETLKKHPDLYSEFKGIAEGAEISEEKLCVLNNYTDIRNFPEEGGCTCIYVKNEKGVHTGQTWDMTADALPYTLHLEIKNKSQHLHVLTVVGCLGLGGTNGDVAVSINDLKTTEVNPEGLQWPALVRLMLNENVASFAFEQLKKNMPVSGHHYLIADKHECFGIETTGKRWKDVHENKTQPYVHTNHYLSELGDASVDMSLSETTKKRLSNTQSFFYEDLSNLDTFEICNKLLGRDYKEGGVCMKVEGIDGEAVTCGGFMINLATGEGQIFADEYKGVKPFKI